MNVKEMTRLTRMMEYARAEMERCIQQDNPFDASYWWKEVNEIQEKIVKLTNEEAV